MKITLNDTLVLAIDFQERLTPAIAEGGQVARRAALLLRGAAALGVPALITRQYPKGLGATIPTIREAAPEAPELDKLSFSLWETPEIRAAILASGKKYVAVCGVEAHICVMQTVRDLAAAGLTPVLVWDAVGSQKRADLESARLRCAAEGAVISSAEALLFELLQCAGSEQFKAVSRLVREYS